jgi:uncharacterized peroxidase-related enzyme
MNPRIPTITNETTTPQVLETLAGVKKSLGMVPNLFATVAQSPAALQAYLGFSGALGHGSLPAKLRESLALAVGEANACDYCVSAHTLLGGMAGLNAQNVTDARRGTAADPKTAVALAFARKVVKDRGVVSDADVQALRTAGYTNGDIVEIVAHVALNLFTNYFNHIAATEIDFPRAEKLAA